MSSCNYDSEGKEEKSIGRLMPEAFYMEMMPWSQKGSPPTRRLTNAAGNYTHLIFELLSITPLIIHLQQDIFQLLLGTTHLLAGSLALPTQKYSDAQTRTYLPLFPTRWPDLSKLETRKIAKVILLRKKGGMGGSVSQKWPKGTDVTQIWPFLKLQRDSKCTTAAVLWVIKSGRS